MNNILRISLAAAVTLIIFLLLALVSSKTKEERSMIACKEVKVEVLDSARLGFVSGEDVRRYIIEDYGNFIGKKIDSVNLKAIETALRARSSLLTAEAWMSSDGVLHVDVTQREPAVRFKTENGGFYADESGYIFPLHQGYDAAVPVIEGKIPLTVAPGFKGYPSTPGQREWLDGILALAAYTEDSKFWKGSISRISSNADGSLVLKPVSGSESFIFGKPDSIKEKFALMEEYYQYIAPAKDSGFYKTVDVRYRGQIVCRQK